MTEFPSLFSFIKFLLGAGAFLGIAATVIMLSLGTHRGNPLDRTAFWHTAAATSVCLVLFTVLARPPADAWAAGLACLAVFVAGVCPVVALQFERKGPDGVSQTPFSGCLCYVAGILIFGLACVCADINRGQKASTPPSAAKAKPLARPLKSTSHFNGGKW